MIKESEILGLSVIIQRSGEKIGNVKKVIYSKNRSKVLALLINEGGYFRESKIIRYKNIRSIGQDTVIIESEKSIEIASTIPQIAEALTNKTQINNYEIIFDNGEALGYIKDIIINEKNGKVIGFIVTEGFVEDLRKGRSILPRMEGISYSENKIIVDSKIKEILDKCEDDYKKLIELQM